MEQRRTRPRFAWAIVAVAALAAVAGLASGPPAAEAPAYALNSNLVYRLEIGMTLFVSLYMAAVVIRLALWGLTPHRLGTASVDLPQVADSFVHARDEVQANLIDIADMLVELEDHEVRIRALESERRRDV